MIYVWLVYLHECSKWISQKAKTEGTFWDFKIGYVTLTDEWFNDNEPRFFVLMLIIVSFSECVHLKLKVFAFFMLCHR
jgi:hypothetical protein